MSLGQLDPHQRAVILHVDCENALKRRLGSLGLFEGASVKIIYKLNGNTIVEVLNTRIGISDKVLSNIEVEVR